MANTTGLSFNPLTGLGYDSDNGQRVPTVVDDYMQPSTPSVSWNPQRLKAAQNFVQQSVNQGMEDWNPLGSIEKWDKGLQGLSEDDYNQWQVDNLDLTQGKSERWQDRLWRNQQFAHAFGKDAFYAIPDKEKRDEIYRSALLGNAVESKYKGNKNLPQLLDLTPQGQEELLKSDYKSDVLMSLRKEDEDQKDVLPLPTLIDRTLEGNWDAVSESIGNWASYGIGDRWRAVVSKLPTRAEQGMFLGGTLGLPLFGIGAGVGMFLGGAAGLLEGVLEGIAHPDDAKSLNASKEQMDNDSILQKIVVADNDRKKKASQADISQLTSQYIQAYQNGQISADDVDSMFDGLALNGKKSVTDELGQTEEYDYTGSNYYTAFKDTEAFSHFGVYDKLRYIAQTQALAQKYGQGSALSILDQDMQNYVNGEQTGWTWTGNTLKNVWVGGVANLAMTAHGMGALGAWVGDKVGTTDGHALERYLDEDGNMQYWNKVDQYNTFGLDDWYNPFSYNPENMERIEQAGGLSPYNNVVKPGTENDFWSWNTLNEAVRMNKFTWSDLAKNLTAAKLLSGAVRAAGGIEVAPGILASESSVGSQILNKAGSWGIMAGSSLGIDAAYGMQTYEDVLNANNERLDKIIDQDIEAEVKRRLESPLAEKEFKELVEAENARRKTRAGERGKFIPVNEVQAWNDYISHITKQVREEQEAAHAEDRQQAQSEAASAYATDASIEALRMSVTSGVFKSYLFDKGTLNAIRANNPYVNVTTKNGLYVMGKDAVRKKALGTLGMNIWGGFQSNYFDDITVGFAKGFGIQSYNNYLLQKYNPAAYGSVMDDYVNPFVAGMVGAAEASEDKRSFIDGAVGAIGSVFSFAPNVQGMVSHRERMRQAAEQAEADKKAGRKTVGISNWEIASDFMNNPILQAVADAKASARMTEREINRVNDIIKENGYALDNIVDMATALNQKAIAREGTSVMEAEDAKDREAFTLASKLVSLKNNGVVANAQAEPDKATWSRKKKAASLFGQMLDGLMGVSVFTPAASPYTAAMQALEDATALDEESSDEARVQRQQEMVNTFLGLDANKNALEGKTEEEQKQFARERLKKNASNLLGMMNKVEELQQKFEKSLGATQNPGLAEQLMYQYVLDDRWKQRLSELEEQIQGDNLAERPQDTQHSNPIAKYGSKAGYERSVKTQEKRVAQAQKEFDKAAADVKKEKAPNMSIAEGARQNAMLRFIERTAKEQLQKEQAILSQMQQDASAFEQVQGEETIISARDILRLNAEDRLRILDDYYRQDYSVAQQAEIDKAKNLLMALPSMRLCRRYGMQRYCPIE